jgi:Lrp/AsnC family transcriptional regulator of ectoine degradation
MFRYIGSALTPIKRLERELIKVDELDLKILAALQQDGRMTKLKLAEAIHLSPTACWERLHRLEDAGIIAGYAARIDMAKLARFTLILVEIVLKSHRHADFHRFETAIRAEPQIVSCDATGGGVDYFLRVMTPDIDAYQRLIDKLLIAEIGIDKYFTYVVTKVIKDEPVAIERIAELRGAAK